MGVPRELAEEIELIDELLKSLPQPEVDMTDPEWFAKLSAGPKPLDQANVRAEAETAQRALLALYERDEPARSEVRALLDRCYRFSEAMPVPRGRTPEAFRHQLLLLSARDHGRDTRDEMVWLNGMCEDARGAGVDIRPLLLEVAELSSAEDKYGMGSIRDILLRAAGRDPVGLW
jgi:hypothetical protein